MGGGDLCVQLGGGMWGRCGKYCAELQQKVSGCGGCRGQAPVWGKWQESGRKGRGKFKICLNLFCSIKLEPICGFGNHLKKTLKLETLVLG